MTPNVPNADESGPLPLLTDDSARELAPEPLAEQLGQLGFELGERFVALRRELAAKDARIAELEALVAKGPAKISARARLAKTG